MDKSHICTLGGIKRADSLQCCSTIIEAFIFYIDYIPHSQRWRSSKKSPKTRWGAHCGSDHALLIAKFRLKLKRVRKTTRAFRYDLNQIPYDYRVDVRNRFNGLDLIDRVPEKLQTEVHDIGLEAVIKTIPKEKKRQNVCLRRPYRKLSKEDK